MAYSKQRTLNIHDLMYSQMKSRAYMAFIEIFRKHKKKNIRDNAEMFADTFAEGVAVASVEVVLSEMIVMGDQLKMDIIKSMSWSGEHKDEFIEAINIDSDGNSLIFTFNTDNWLIDAIENGHPEYSIKEIMLNRKSNTSKDGHRYRSVPIENRDYGKTPDPDFGTPQYEQSKVKEVIAQLKYKYSLIEEIEEKETGSYIRRERFDIPNKRLRASRPKMLVERIRKFNNRLAYKKHFKPIQTSFVSFKGMSDRPDSSPWVHPGWNPGAHILEELYESCKSRATAVMNHNLRDILDSMLR